MSGKAGWDRDGRARDCPPDALGDGCVGDPWELRHRTIGPWETAPQSWRERTGVGEGGSHRADFKVSGPPQPSTPKLLLGQGREGLCTLQRAVLDSTAERELLPQGAQSGCLHCLFMPLPPFPATAWVRPSCLLQHLHSHPCHPSIKPLLECLRDTAQPGPGIPGSHSARRPTLESVHF